MAPGRPVLRSAVPVLTLMAAVVASAAADVRVKSGTGFFVSRDGFVLTSAHVVSGCPELSVWGAERSQHAAYVVASDRRLDIALLWTEGMRPRRSAVAGRDAPHAGEEVFTLGFGVVTTNPLQPVPVEGVLVGTSTAEPGNRVVTIRANLHAGNSGGALLAQDGSLIGMIVGRDEKHDDIGVAVPQDTISPLLTAYGIKLADRDAATNPRDLLAKISVLVQCGSSAADNASAR